MDEVRRKSDTMSATTSSEQPFFRPSRVMAAALLNRPFVDALEAMDLQPGRRTGILAAGVYELLNGQLWLC